MSAYAHQTCGASGLGSMLDGLAMEPTRPGVSYEGIDGVRGIGAVPPLQETAPKVVVALRFLVLLGSLGATLAVALAGCVRRASPRIVSDQDDTASITFPHRRITMPKHTPPERRRPKPKKPKK